MKNHPHIETLREAGAMNTQLNIQKSILVAWVRRRGLTLEVKEEGGEFYLIGPNGGRIHADFKSALEFIKEVQSP